MRRLVAIALLSSLPATAAELSFNRDIRPILSDHCYACHGFDKAARKADLRLDNVEGATAVIDGARAIVPGDPAASEAMKRMLSTDPEEMMPPPKAKKPIKPEDVATIKQWIAQGAKYEGHWAFTPPVRPAVPKVAAPGGMNAIDAFILSRLEREGLKPAAPADKVTLLRRVTYDLTGLPPTPAEIDAFLSDQAPEAYEKVVDRLLQSPRYGEKMAVHWLDLARYADTHGYHLDSGRTMWPWRDWVIAAFNKNQPFDQFVRWQLAGDLLPEHLPEQKLATGFVRNNMINFEGGAIAEEYLNAYLVDRVNTFGTVFLGLSVNCTQCHDHKYDPLTQREFYQLYAYFNAVPERGLDGSAGNASPVMALATGEQQKHLEDLKRAVASAEEAVAQVKRGLGSKQADLEKSSANAKTPQWTVLPPVESKAANGTQLVAQGDGSVLATGMNPGTEEYIFTLKLPKSGVTALRLEALTDDSLASHGPGRASNGNFVLTDLRVEDARDGKEIQLANASADYEQQNFPASAIVDGDVHTGWAVDGNLKHETRTAWLAFAQPVTATALRVKLGFHSNFAGHGIGRARFSVSSDAAPLPAKGLPAAVADALRLSEPLRTKAQRQAIEEFLAQQSPEMRDLTKKLEQAQKEYAEAEKAVPTVMVMEQMKDPRETHIRVRGDYATLGDKVEPNVPAVLGKLPADAPKDRRALAAWITDRKHPLLARVTMNRLWRNLFGTGIVKTVNDFGLQGEWPSHPELLDWLAVEFMDKGWDVKAMMRLMVTSATYRQSAAIKDPEALRRDPDNRLLARGPRFRLSAEEIRDTALAVSGLLTPRVGGPSVYPYQPEGLWQELSSRGDSKKWSAQFFEQSHGEDLYRRSMYTFIKRTCPPPQMQTFDAPDREVCTAQRERTNTPLQALVTLNDPTYVEASRILAEKMLTQGGGTPEARVQYAFRLATARIPTPRESALLVDLYQRQHARFTSEPRAAAELLTTGEAPLNKQLPAPELAAWTIVASTILNLDETLTRG